MVDPLKVLNPSKPAAPGFVLTRLTDGSNGIPFNAICAVCLSFCFISGKICLFYLQPSCLFD